MEVIDNISSLLGDNLKRVIAPGSKLKIAASCFSIYAYEALKTELSKVESLEFIFTSPTFVPSDVTDKLKKEHREFHIPKLERERSLYGSEFEVRLRNELTQRAIAKECVDWTHSVDRQRSFNSPLSASQRAFKSSSFNAIPRISGASLKALPSRALAATATFASAPATEISKWSICEKRWIPGQFKRRRSSP